MGSYRIVLLPGDGIGPEVMEAAVTVLEAASHPAEELELTFLEHRAGAGLYRETGETLPAEVLAACLAADAVLLSAIGLPDVRKPDGTEVQPEMMMGLRRGLGLRSALRPIRLYPGVRCPLTTAESGIDMVIVRENLEGLFASFGGGCRVGDELATDTIVITREGTRQVCEEAFRLAARRGGRPADGRKVVTCVDKANVFRSFALFRKTFEEVARGHPDIGAETVYVDAMSLYMVQNPSRYDVLVMENQFGDILSDLGAALVGGLGFAPSAELGPDHGLFQPSHGSAPDLAGKNLANPLALILSAAMMLEWLGERHGDESAARTARRIERAVETALESGEARTADIGGRRGTREAARAVARAME